MLTTIMWYTYIPYDISNPFRKPPSLGIVYANEIVINAKMRLAIRLVIDDILYAGPEKTLTKIRYAII